MAARISIAQVSLPRELMIGAVVLWWCRDWQTKNPTKHARHPRVIRIVKYVVHHHLGFACASRAVTDVDHTDRPSGFVMHERGEPHRPIAGRDARRGQGALSSAPTLWSRARKETAGEKRRPSSGRLSGVRFTPRWRRSSLSRSTKRRGAKPPSAAPTSRLSERARRGGPRRRRGSRRPAVPGKGRR